MHGKDDSDGDKKKDENLTEAGQWVIRIKKGKRVKKLECPPGFKVDSGGRRCKKQSAKDIKTGKKAARKRMKKMKAQMGKIQKKRAKSLKKRASMNI
jgi:50S ribosomal subunit-associated GTPase HflX